MRFITVGEAYPCTPIFSGPARIRGVYVGVSDFPLTYAFYRSVIALRVRTRQFSIIRVFRIAVFPNALLIASLSRIFRSRVVNNGVRIIVRLFRRITLPDCVEVFKLSHDV